MRIALVTWADGRPTGGNVYNAELAAALRAEGCGVEVHRVPGAWPDGSPADRARLADVLHALDVAIVDGIVAGGAPAQVADAVASGHDVSVLVHMALGAEVGLASDVRSRREGSERAALHAASRVLCTSRWAAQDLRRRYGVSALVAAPGVRPAALAAGSVAPESARLLCLATVAGEKDQLGLVRALTLLRDLDWTVGMVGSVDADPTYASMVRAEIDAAGLADRIELTGALVGEALERQWQCSDLLVLPSHTETFGLVVVEALAHGIPVVVRAGTGAVEALAVGTRAGSSPAPGCAVTPGEVGTLAAVLRAWLTEPDLRERWRTAAQVRRGILPAWDETARAVLGHLAR